MIIDLAEHRQHTARQKAGETKKVRTRSKVVAPATSLMGSCDRPITAVETAITAGISPPTFYNHFDDILDPIGHVSEMALDRIGSDAGVHTYSHTPLQSIEHFVDLLIEESNRPVIHAAYFYAPATTRPVRDSLARILETLLYYFKEETQIDQGVDTVGLASFHINAMVSMIATRTIKNDALRTIFIDQILKGIGYQHVR